MSSSFLLLLPIVNIIIIVPSQKYDQHNDERDSPGHVSRQRIPQLTQILFHSNQFFREGIQLSGETFNLMLNSSSLAILAHRQTYFTYLESYDRGQAFLLKQVA